MERLAASVRVRIWGSRNCWSLEPTPGAGGASEECEVALEIQGTRKSGYNLVMSPAGFFTADSWYETKAEALEDAQELFGVTVGEWNVIP